MWYRWGFWILSIITFTVVTFGLMIPVAVVFERIEDSNWKLLLLPLWPLVIFCGVAASMGIVPWLNRRLPNEWRLSKDLRDEDWRRIQWVRDPSNPPVSIHDIGRGDSGLRVIDVRWTSGWRLWLRRLAWLAFFAALVWILISKPKL
jgi:hypothetical protein